MYIYDIGSIDDRYPEDDDNKAQDLFHEILLSNSLKHFLRKIGIEK